MSPEPTHPKLSLGFWSLTPLATGENNLLQDFYKSQGDWASGGGLHNKDNWFKLTFQNYAGITYCEDASNKCVNGIFTYRNKCMH